MPEKTWKSVERKAARMDGTERTGPQGKHVDDHYTNRIAVETKHRKSMPQWIEKAIADADD